MSHKSITTRFAILAICCVVSTAVLAEEQSPPPPAVTPSLTVGVLEVAGVHELTGHLGVYATFAFGLSVPLADGWALIPSIGFEFCPEFGNWGATFFLTADKLLYESERLLIALDPYIGLIHDAMPDPDHAGDFLHTALVGAGIGPSFILGRTTLSPSLAVYVDVKSKAVVLNPTLLFSVSF